MNYKDKLEGFNNSDKYQKELEFLRALIGYDHDRVLDYGCGNGYAVNQFNLWGGNVFFGYDVNLHNSDFGYSELLGKYDLTYFMHSFAHVKDIDKVLGRLRTKEVVVITPNKTWIDKNTNDNYKPDTTVIKHYHHYELVALFQDNGYEVILSGQFGSATSGTNERLFLKAKKL